jgi:N-acetylglucosamine transport system permease protein
MVALQPVAARPLRRASSSRRIVSRVLWVAGLVFIGAWVVFNIALLVWVVLNSFRGGSAIFSRPFELPTTFDFVNYVNAWSRSNLGIGFFNSVVLVITASLVTVVLAAMAANALARTRVRSAGPLTTLFAVGLGIPVQVIVIPMWVFMHQLSSFAYDVLGWWDDRISLFLLYVATSLPFAVFLLTGYFRSLPTEVEEAASIDGAGPWRSFFSVVWPMARSGIVTALMLTGLGLWNETLLALVFITDDDKNTLPQALLGLYGTMQYTADWGGLFAGILIVVLPTLVVYAFLGRRFVEGMTLGAGK